MEKRESQTTNRPAQRDDHSDPSRRDQDSKRNPNETSQNKGGQNKGDQNKGDQNRGDPNKGDANRSGGQNTGQTQQRSGQSQNRSEDDSDDETSSTPGGNPTRGVNPGTSNPAPGSIREHQSPGCEGLGSSTCGTKPSGQTLGEPDQAEQRPL